MSRPPLDARVSQEDVPALYDKLSRSYDLWGRIAEAKARTRAIELAAIRDGDSLLEVAVGTGLAFFELVRRNPGGRNVGIDLSPGMLAKARARMEDVGHDNYTLAIGSAFDLAVQTGSVDLLINNYMFDLIPFADMDRILVEFRRVLKAAGRLVLVNMTEVEGLGARIYGWIYRLSPKAIGGCRGVNLSDRLERTGFQVRTREVYRQFLFPSEVMVATPT